MKIATVLTASILAFMTFAVADEPEKIVEEPAIVKNYQEAVKYFAKWSNEMEKPERYKDFSFTIQEEPVDGKEPETKKISFKDIPEFDRDMFYLQQYEICSNHMAHLTKLWDMEIAKLKKLTPKEREDRRAPDNILDKKQFPTMEQIEEFKAELGTVRKSNAVAYESAIEKTFKKYKDKIPAEDRATYTRKVKAWHDSNKLIDRK